MCYECVYIFSYVCLRWKETFIDFYSGFSNVRGHKPVSYVCLELNVAMQM